MDDSDYRRPIINAFFLIGQHVLGNKMNFSLSVANYLSQLALKCNKTFELKTCKLLILNSIKMT
jgi:hypothetical protein